MSYVCLFLFGGGIVLILFALLRPGMDIDTYREASKRTRLIYDIRENLYTVAFLAGVAALIAVMVIVFGGSMS